MEQIVLEAFAKLNLSLDIKGRREDGYHLMEMVMQSVDISDTVRIRKDSRLSVVADKKEVPNGEKNIAYRAAQAFFAAAGLKAGADIFLEKRIPSQAGMAGGSADGAAVLKGLNLLYETGFSEEQLMEIGLPIGADLPFCLKGGTALVEGIGEKVTRVSPLKGVVFAVVKPDFGISTKEAFQRYDALGAKRRPDTQGLLYCIEKGETARMGSYMANVLEEAAEDERIFSLIRRLKAHGALASRMTGSGSTVFGVFPDLLSAERAVRDEVSEKFVAFPVEEGVKAV